MPGLTLTADAILLSRFLDCENLLKILGEKRTAHRPNIGHAAPETGKLATVGMVVIVYNSPSS